MPFVKYNSDKEITAISTFPQEDFVWINELPEDYVRRQKDLQDNSIYRSQLTLSDWKVIRQRDQKGCGHNTSMTQKEYKAFLEKRQEWRDSVKHPLDK